MSLERDITNIMEADVFKPAGPEELKGRGYTGKVYAIWYDNYLDGMLYDKAAALAQAKRSDKGGLNVQGKRVNVEVYEIPMESSFYNVWSSKRYGERIYP